MICSLMAVDRPSSLTWSLARTARSFKVTSEVIPKDEICLWWWVLRSTRRVKSSLGQGGSSGMMWVWEEASIVLSWSCLPLSTLYSKVLSRIWSTAWSSPRWELWTDWVDLTSKSSFKRLRKKSTAALCSSFGSCTGSHSPITIILGY